MGDKMNNKRNVGVRLSEADREILENIAKKYDITISDVVRMAIKEFLKNNEIKLREVSS
jgi:antitoxin component of RelBE/YafQ-DinJ toxin-antitoxin module